MIKNYIWDFDGMLFDSYPHITAAFQKVMAEDGVDIDYTRSKQLFEISYAHAFEYYNATQEQKMRFFDYEHDTDFEPVAVPFPNTVITLKKVCENGGRNYLYTHRGNNAFDYLKKYGIYDLFSDFVTHENGFPAKPAPDAIEFLVNKHNLDKSETVMVGDREIDVMSGINAGVKGCLYTTQPKETNATYVVDDIIKTLDLEV